MNKIASNAFHVAEMLSNIKELELVYNAMLVVKDGSVIGQNMSIEGYILIDIVLEVVEQEISNLRRDIRKYSDINLV